MSTRNADTERLNATWEAANDTRELQCGCITRADVGNIRWCRTHNEQVGTHFGKPGYAAKGRGGVK